MEAMEEALLADAAVVILPLSTARVVGAVTAGHVVIKGGEVEGRRLSEGAVLACPVVIQGVRCCRHCSCSYGVPATPFLLA
jgi:hypothetical protein